MPRKKTPGSGKPGPRPTPTATLERKGSPLAAKRKAKGEVTPAQTGKIPSPPPLRDDKSREYWDYIAPRLHNENLLTDLDCIALAQLCDALSLQDAERRAIGEQFLIETQYGTSKNPVLPHLDRVWDQIMVACREFGLTPAARVNLNIKPAEKPKGEIVQAKRRFGGGKK